MDSVTKQVPRVTARLAGGFVAGGMLLVGIAAVVVIRPLGARGMTAVEQPELVIGALLVVAGLGWAAARSASSGGWPRAIGIGALQGIAVWPAFTLVAVFVSVVDAMIRGAAGPLDGLGVGLALGLYAFAVIGIVASIITVPLGILWGLLTLAFVRRGSLSSGGRKAWPTLLVGLAVVSLVGGATRAAAAQPDAAVCRSVGDGYVVDAAFSRAGDLLAVGTQTDPNEPGTIVLLSWPSGEVLARWTTWLDAEVTVSPEGEVYWSAWVLGSFPRNDTMTDEGVYVARPGEEPEWFATGFETPLNDLTWTTQGLRGTTPNSHRVASLEYGATAPTTSRGEVGAFWSSADALWTATGPAWKGTTVALVGPGTTVDIPVPGDQRSIAVTADRSTLIAASWFDGTRTIDVATGATRLIIRGSQRFVALSSRGDLAWANEEPVGKSQLCTAALAEL